MLSSFLISRINFRVTLQSHNLDVSKIRCAYKDLGQESSLLSQGTLETKLIELGQCLVSRSPYSIQFNQVQPFQSRFFSSCSMSCNFNKALPEDLRESLHPLLKYRLVEYSVSHHLVENKIVFTIIFDKNQRKPDAQSQISTDIELADEQPESGIESEDNAVSVSDSDKIKIPDKHVHFDFKSSTNQAEIPQDLRKQTCKSPTYDGFVNRVPKIEPEDVPAYSNIKSPVFNGTLKKDDCAKTFRKDQEKDVPFVTNTGSNIVSPVAPRRKIKAKKAKKNKKSKNEDKMFFLSQNTFVPQLDPAEREAVQFESQEECESHDYTTKFLSYAEENVSTDQITYSDRYGTTLTLIVNEDNTVAIQKVKSNGRVIWRDIESIEQIFDVVNRNPFKKPFLTQCSLKTSLIQHKTADGVIPFTEKQIYLLKLLYLPGL